MVCVLLLVFFLITKIAQHVFKTNKRRENSYVNKERFTKLKRVSKFTNKNNKGRFEKFLESQRKNNREKFTNRNNNREKFVNGITGEPLK